MWPISHQPTANPREHGRFFLSSFVVYFLTRESAGTSTRDLEFGREVAFPFVSQFATWEFRASAVWVVSHINCAGSVQADAGKTIPPSSRGSRDRHGLSVGWVSLIHRGECNQRSIFNAAVLLKKSWIGTQNAQRARCPQRKQAEQNDEAATRGRRSEGAGRGAVPRASTLPGR